MIAENLLLCLKERSTEFRGCLKKQRRSGLFVSCLEWRSDSSVFELLPTAHDFWNAFSDFINALKYSFISFPQFTSVDLSVIEDSSELAAIMRSIHEIITTDWMDACAFIHKLQRMY